MMQNISEVETKFIYCCRAGVLLWSGSGPRSNAVWTWMYSPFITSKIYILWDTTILTGAAFLMFTTNAVIMRKRRWLRLGNEQNNHLRVKPSHVTLLSQSRLCMACSKHSGTVKCSEADNEWDGDRKNVAVQEKKLWQRKNRAFNGWSHFCSFLPLAAQNQCLTCSETVALIKSVNVQQHYDTTN